jgi:hypothetical protein
MLATGTLKPKKLAGSDGGYRFSRRVPCGHCAAEQPIASRLGNHSAQIELIAIKAKHKVPNGR